MGSGGTLPLRSGTYVGSGAEQTIEVGFSPVRVTLYVVDDPAVGTWTDTMDNGDCAVQTDTFVFHGGGNGITPTSTGFTVGTLADINTAGETVHWVAEG